eukprot:207099-Hanusia_phi.AAC.2
MRNTSLIFAALILLQSSGRNAQQESKSLASNSVPKKEAAKIKTAVDGPNTTPLQKDSQQEKGQVETKNPPGNAPGQHKGGRGGKEPPAQKNAPSSGPGQQRGGKQSKQQVELTTSNEAAGGRGGRTGREHGKAPAREGATPRDQGERFSQHNFQPSALPQNQQNVMENKPAPDRPRKFLQLYQPPPARSGEGSSQGMRGARHGARGRGGGMHNALMEFAGGGNMEEDDETIARRMQAQFDEEERVRAAEARLQAMTLNSTKSGAMQPFVPAETNQQGIMESLFSFDNSRSNQEQDPPMRGRGRGRFKMNQLNNLSDSWSHDRGRGGGRGRRGH